MPRFALAAALAAAVVLSSCDASADEAVVVFQGVELAARGDARLAQQDNTLVVSGLEGNRSGGFAISGAPARVDVEVQPLRVPEGARFGIRVEGRDGRPLASIDTQGEGDGRFSLPFFFANELGATAVAVRYRLRGDLVLEIPRLPLLPDGRQRAAASAGEGEGDTGSVHVIRRADGRYVVVSDSEGSSGQRAAGCPGFTILPPVSVKGPLCVDWVEVEPLGSTASPAVGAVVVTGQGVGSFTVVDLARQ